MSAPKPSRFVPPPGPPRVLVAAQLVSTLGDGAYYVTAALYFTRVVGLSPVQLGAGLTAAWAVALLAGVPLGHAADRFGPRGAASALTAVAGLSCVGYLFIRSFPLFIAAAAVYAVSTRGAIAARQAALAGVVPQEKRTEIRAYIQTSYNAGLAIGATLGGVALHFDTRTAYLSVFAFNAVSFVLAAALLQTRLPAVPARPAADGRAPALAVLRDRPYALLSLLNLVLVLHVPLIDVALPLWVVRHTDAPRSVLAAIFLLNTVVVVLFQVRVARGVTDVASATRYVRWAGVVLLASCVAFASSAAGSSAWLAVAFLLLAAALQAAAEMAQFAGTWELSFALAPPDKHGQYQGFFGSGMAAAEMIGPLLLTTLVVTWGAPGWFVLGTLFVLAGFAMQPAVQWAERTRAAEPAVPTVAPALAGASETSRPA